MKIKYLILVVLLKKTGYNTKVAEIDDKTAKNENEVVKNILEDKKALAPLFLWNTIFDSGDGSRSYLIFQPVHKYIKIIANPKIISEWKSKGLSDESIKPFPTSDNSLAPLFDYYNYYKILKFNGSILRQPRISDTHGKKVNIFIVYELGASSSNDNDPTLKNCLFGAVTLTKNADIEKI